MTRYNFKETEAKWRSVWDEKGLFKTPEARQDNKEKFYVLTMFPYPSGRIHVGHMRNYVMGDVVARYKKAHGYNVLHPMGWDAFGLPAENAARDKGVHPGKWTHENIAQMKTQIKEMGITYYWGREITTCDADYYKHEQKMFLDFLKNGIAYQKEGWVNWDPVEQTVLANEQVEDGKGWRSGAPVERKQLTQWFLKITDYADDLLEAIDTDLKDWPERVRIMQRNWIGKSQGLTFDFEITPPSNSEAVGREINPPSNSEAVGHKIKVFTTRPDTIFGASFVALSPDHPLVAEMLSGHPELEDFIAECRRQGTSEAALETADKLGLNTGLTVKHPFLDGHKLPVFIANFILMEYGTGAIFGCPAHDQRDLDFARKYGLNVTPVVIPEGETEHSFAVDNEAYTGDGTLGNSEFLNGMDVQTAKAEIIKRMEEAGIGEATTTYRLRDWGVSRQRYWGCPIPVIYCGDCGTVPVPENDLPVTLPEDVDLNVSGNPLDHHPTWKNVACPACDKDARRETDTFDTFF